jgi:hypothetical protein
MPEPVRWMAYMNPDGSRGARRRLNTFQLNPRYPTPQAFAEIRDIIKSLPTVKGVRIEVNASYFGVSWAAAQDQARYIGVVDKWKDKVEGTLMVKWEGWDRNRATLLGGLEKDEDEESLDRGTRVARQLLALRRRPPARAGLSRLA